MMMQFFTRKVISCCVSDEFHFGNCQFGFIFGLHYSDFITIKEQQKKTCISPTIIKFIYFCTTYDPKHPTLLSILTCNTLFLTPSKSEKQQFIWNKHTLQYVQELLDRLSVWCHNQWLTNLPRSTSVPQSVLLHSNIGTLQNWGISNNSTDTYRRNLKFEKSLLSAQIIGTALHRTASSHIISIY